MQPLSYTRAVTSHEPDEQPHQRRTIASQYREIVWQVLSQGEKQSPSVGFDQPAHPLPHSEPGSALPVAPSPPTSYTITDHDDIGVDPAESLINDMHVNHSDGIQYQHSNHSNPCRALYMANEAARDSRFTKAIENHDTEFRTAELRRSLFADRLERGFQSEVRVLETIFSASQAHFASMFDNTESYRGTLESTRRSRFTHALEDHETRFNRKLSWYITQLEASILGERDFAITLEARVSRLLCSMGNIVENMKRKCALESLGCARPEEYWPRTTVRCRQHAGSRHEFGFVRLFRSSGNPSQ